MRVRATGSRSLRLRHPDAVASRIDDRTFRLRRDFFHNLGTTAPSVLSILHNECYSVTLRGSTGAHAASTSSRHNRAPINYRDILFAFHDTPDVVVRFAQLIEMRSNEVGLLCVCDYDHADAHVESAVHRPVRNVSNPRHHLKDWKHRPRAAFNLNARTLRQNTRNILEQPAAGDVSESVDRLGVKQIIERAKIASMGLEQLLGDRTTELVDSRTRLVRGSVQKT